MVKEDPRRSLIGRASAFCQRKTIELSHGSIAPGDIMKEWFYNRHGEPVRRKLVVIPNGVRDLDVEREMSVFGGNMGWTVRSTASFSAL